MDYLSRIDLLPTLLFVFVTTYTPGPNNIVAGSMGALYGYRRTAPFLLGIASGFLVVMLVCCSLTTAMSSYLSQVARFVKYIGAGYILWLAYSVYRSSSLIDKPEQAKPLRYRDGLLLQFVNPKAAFYGLTVSSVFLMPVLDEPATFILAPPLLALVAFSAISTWALAGHIVRRWLNTPARVRVLGAVLALALVYTALDLLGVMTIM